MVPMSSSMSVFLEGVGDASQLDSIYSTVYTNLCTRFLNKIDSMYDLVTGKEHEVIITIPDLFGHVDTGYLTIRVLMGEPWMKPGYSTRTNTITLLLRPWLTRAGWVFRPNRVLPLNFGKKRFCRDMESSLSYEIRHMLDTPSVHQMLTHELLRYFDNGTLNAMTHRAGPADSFEQDRQNRIDANPSRMAGRDVEWVRDQLFPATYKSETYVGNDHMILKKARTGFGPDDYAVYTHGPKDPKYDELIRRSNLYKLQAKMSSNSAIRTKVAEQLPWLLSQRSSNAQKLDVMPTVEHMMAHVFSIPDSGSYVPARFSSLEEYQAHHMQKALPEARRSTLKRLAKLVIEVNEIDVERYRTVPMRLRFLVYLLASHTKPRRH